MKQTKIGLFEQLFRELFKPLCQFGLKYVNDTEVVRGLVHEVFVSVWEKFETLPADSNYKSYLYTAIRNRCLNFIRDNRKTVRLSVVPEAAYQEENRALETAELEKEIELAIQSLPEKCRMVFQLNRFEGLRYAQIAKKMNISKKTVEAQMTKALRILRERLGQFLSLLVLLLGQ